MTKSKRAVAKATALFAARILAAVLRKVCSQAWRRCTLSPDRMGLARRRMGFAPLPFASLEGRD
jgi:hypothetical protein